MEYPQQAWLAFFVSILSAYILGTSALSAWSISNGPTTGYGDETPNGFDSHDESGKPYNSGDARAGM